MKTISQITFALLASVLFCACSPSDEKLRAKAEALEARNAELEKKLTQLDQKLTDLQEQLALIDDSYVPTEPETPEVPSNPELAKIAELFPQAEKTASGLHYIVTKEGTGDTSPMVGQAVTVHYTGTFLDGEKFDSSLDRNRPYTFKVGLGNVIKGWDEAFLSMKAGEKRTLIIPSWLGYGDKNYGQIPGKTTLLFDIELISFK